MPFAKAATFPWKSHALWFYSQMVRWGQVAHTGREREDRTRDLSARPLSRRAEAARRRSARRQRQGRGRAAAATPVGSAGASLMLGPDGFFDGAIFDPDQLDGYIAAQNAIGFGTIRTAQIFAIALRNDQVWSCARPGVEFDDRLYH